MVKLSLDAQGSQELAKEHPSNYSSIYTKILSGYVLWFKYQKGNYTVDCGLCILQTVHTADCAYCGLNKRKVIHTVQIHATVQVLRSYDGCS